MERICIKFECRRIHDSGGSWNRFYKGIKASREILEELLNEE